MNTLREAAQQALEALEHSETTVPYEGFGIEHREAVRLHAEAITALKQALAEPEQPVAIKWALNGDKRCGYDNWLGETPFGRILITWKSWKEFPEASVDEFPGDFTAYGDPEKVKVECEAEFRRRIGIAPTPRKPLTDEEMHECAQAMDAEPLAEGWPELIKFARAIERAHGIKE